MHTRRAIEIRTWLPLHMPFPFSFVIQMLSAEGAHLLISLQGQGSLVHNVLERNYRPMLYAPCRYRALGAISFALPVSWQEIPLVKSTSSSAFASLDRSNTYLQETVMLDLLRIVGHHKARLATQTRTVQRSYGNADIDNIPFGEGTYSRVPGRPLLIDTSARISDDKPKPRRTSRDEKKVKTSTSVDHTKSASPDTASSSNSEKQEQKKLIPEDGRMKNSKNDHLKSTPSSSRAENFDPVTPTSKMEPLGSAATERQGDSSVSVANPKKEARPALEENIVLGVALEGSKRTLLIEGGLMDPHLSETEEDTVEAASSHKDKKGPSHTL